MGADDRRMPETERALEILTCYVAGSAAFRDGDETTYRTLIGEGHRLIVEAHLLNNLPAIAEALAVELAGTWEAYCQCLERDPLEVWQSVRLVDAQVRADDDEA